jgi:hypothetical protein
MYQIFRHRELNATIGCSHTWLAYSKRPSPHHSPFLASGMASFHAGIYLHGCRSIMLSTPSLDDVVFSIAQHGQNALLREPEAGPQMHREQSSAGCMSPNRAHTPAPADGRSRETAEAGGSSRRRPTGRRRTETQPP